MTRARAIPLVFSLVAAAAGAQQPTVADQAEPDVRAFLLHDASLSPRQLASLAGGDVVIKTLPTSDHNDVAVLGVIRIPAPTTTVVAAAHGIGAPDHLFGSPASVDDLQALHLSDNDLKQLAQCKPGDCSSKLDSTDMAALRAIMSASTPDAAQRAEDYLRQRIFQYVRAYQQQGDSAMPFYDDRRRTSAAAAFNMMVRDSCTILRLAPAVARDLAEYPRAPSGDAASSIYWTVDSMPRTRPVLRVMHEIDYRAGDTSGLTVIATKQLYANHYFDAGLEILAAVDDSVAAVSGAGAGTIVIVARHYRFDQIPKIGPFDLRGRVVSRLRDVIERDLKQLRATSGH